MQESTLQAQIYTFWGQSEYRHISFLFSIPNEGKASYGEAARLKAMGLTAGMPDLCLIDKNGKAHFVELKTPTGKLSTNQRIIHQRLTDLMGKPPTIIRSVSEFGHWLKTTLNT